MWTFHPPSHHGIHRRPRRHWWLALLVNPRALCPNDGPLQEAVSVAWSRRGATGGFRSHGSTPSHHPFTDGIFPWIFPKKNHPAIEYPHWWKPPISGVNLRGMKLHQATELQESIQQGRGHDSNSSKMIAYSFTWRCSTCTYFVYAILFNVYT